MSEEDQASGPPLTQDRYYDVALRYFLYQADQRMKAFNFYILFMAALIAGAVALATKSTGSAPPLWVFSLFGFTVAIMSTIFFFLDLRCKQLVNLGVDALVASEKTSRGTGNAEPFHLFISYKSQRNEGNWFSKKIRYAYLIPACMVVWGSIGLILGLTCFAVWFLSVIHCVFHEIVRLVVMSGSPS